MSVNSATPPRIVAASFQGSPALRRASTRRTACMTHAAAAPYARSCRTSRTRRFRYRKSNGAQRLAATSAGLPTRRKCAPSSKAAVAKRAMRKAITRVPTARSGFRVYPSRRQRQHRGRLTSLSVPFAPPVAFASQQIRIGCHGRWAGARMRFHLPQERTARVRRAPGLSYRRTRGSLGSGCPCNARSLFRKHQENQRRMRVSLAPSKRAW